MHSPIIEESKEEKIGEQKSENFFKALKTTSVAPKRFLYWLMDLHFMYISRNTQNKGSVKIIW